MEVTRKRLKQFHRSTLDPRSKFIRTWDIVVIFALLFTSFVTPFHVAFLEFNPSVLHAPIDFVSNRIVDSVFLCDVVITFFLPYLSFLFSLSPSSSS